MTAAMKGGRGTWVIGLGLLACLVGCRQPAGGPHHDADVLMVVIDTLRADALSSYGNPRSTTPHLDRLARGGLLFERVFAPAPQTGPSHASIFTGLHPWVHRVSNDHRQATQVAHLPDVFETLAERFQRAGYQTAAITDGAVLREDYGLDQGFDSYLGIYEGVERKVDRAIRFLESERNGRPLFLFLHTYQVHQPYVSPRRWVERFDPTYNGPLRQAEDEIRRQYQREGFQGSEILLRNRDSFTPRDVGYLRTLYEAAVAYTDHELNRLWVYLDDSGQLDNMVLVVTSDHGEELGEHGHLGHRELFRETVQVPLIITLPNDPLTARVPTPVGLIDLHRTLLRIVGLDPSPTSAGIDLLEAVRRGTVPARPLFAETTDHFYPAARDQTARLSVRFGSHVLIERGDGLVERHLFDADRDVDEQRPVAMTGRARDLVAELGGLLNRHRVEQAALRRAILAGWQGAGVGPSLDPETLRELRALGYIGR